MTAGQVTTSAREASIAGARRLLRQADAAGPAPAGDLSRISRLVAVVASSRGGSSLLHQLLADHPDALSVAGEHTALYRLNRLDRGPDGSDVLPADVGFDHAQFAADFLGLLRGSRPDDPHPGPAGVEAYAVAVARRLALQWPLEAIEYSAVREATAYALAGCADPTDPAAVFGRLLGRLRHRHPRLDPDVYDLPAALRRRPSPAAFGPPTDGYCIEEPPFVVPRPRALPDAADLGRRVVVVKSSVDAYRLPLLRRLMPGARLRIIHLTRNPAAAVNGLYDGWRDRGFFSYDVSDEVELSIAGYRELGPAARRWWNFDLPPGWRALADSPLEAVCAAQWAGAHRAILEGLDLAGAEAVMRLPFERLIDPATRNRTLDAVFAFAGLRSLPHRQQLPVVMATARPGPARWRRRVDLLAPAVRQPAVAEVAAELGYRWKENARWT
ncbi:sulfotransferase [Kitasatospora sp. NBC_00240]|uniref:sulfotransferase n=1 Tax=Kitasatospora sp. NBC_00240 TaxID=2903567 RepID=UPI002251AE63|nr:sulfotransferase [Kitasatospora sp. NBC_00240]MCX5208700.1 sulfotransferase [Kitasatospora sp. NBC_00240]